MRRSELEKLLTERLRLKQPIFCLKKLGSSLSGHVVSDTFKGMDNLRRLDKVWDVLDAEYGVEAPRNVGILLLYTQDEWNMDLPELPRPKPIKKKKPKNSRALLRSSGRAAG